MELFLAAAIFISFMWIAVKVSNFGDSQPKIETWIPSVITEDEVIEMEKE